MDDKIIRTLKPLDSLNLDRVEWHGCSGYNCVDTGGFINDEMVELFDGMTVLEFEREEPDADDEDSVPYEYKWDRWSFSKHWFKNPDENDWLAEEDFAL